jgi:uncharacterized protein (TIGR02996 family)
MHDEGAFLNKLLENPADDTVRLVYADWLDERGDDQSTTKATFLRMTAQLLEPNRTAGWRKTLRKQMQPLAAKLPTDWLAVVSRLKVENCGAKRAESRRSRRISLLFDFVCEKRWDELTVSENKEVRFCEVCKENVHYCDTITEAREHAQRGHCVAVDLGIIRREHDLSPPLAILGRPSVEMLQKEEERCQVDAVSREREERKRQQNAGDDSV